MKEYISNSIDDTYKIAANFAKSLKNGDVVCLNGNLGAGKTAFVSGVAKALNISDNIASPTFNILLQYKNDSYVINHFDLYRLESTSDLDDIGFYEIIESNSISFIEWPDKFTSCIPQDAINVYIDKIDEKTRKISISR